MYITAIIVVLTMLVSTSRAESTNVLEGINLTIAGTGATKTSSPNSSTFGLELGLGKEGTLVLPVEAGIRQSIGYDDSQGSSLLFSTKGYADWTVARFGNLELLVGANLGGIYGNTSLTWVAAPEAVVRLWLKKDVSVYGRTEYGFNLSDNTKDDTLQYTVGVSVRF